MMVMMMITNDDDGDDDYLNDVVPDHALPLLLGPRRGVVNGLSNGAANRAAGSHRGLYWKCARQQQQHKWHQLHTTTTQHNTEACIASVLDNNNNNNIGSVLDNNNNTNHINYTQQSSINNTYIYIYHQRKPTSWTAVTPLTTPSPTAATPLPTACVEEKYDFECRSHVESNESILVMRI